MTSTIFCTFEQQDLADLAMGRVRQVAGVQSIHYIRGADYRRAQPPADAVSGFEVAVGAANATTGGGPAIGWAPVSDLDYDSAEDRPSPSATVKIVCDDASRERVVGMLVNLHAHRIVVTP